MRIDEHMQTIEEHGFDSRLVVASCWAKAARTGERRIDVLEHWMKQNIDSPTETLAWDEIASNGYHSAMDHERQYSGMDDYAGSNTWDNAVRALEDA